MVKLILMRHGQSLWNLQNLFTGWVDIPLSEKGIEEAMQGGRAIAHEPIDMIFTSTLIRAQMTAMLAMAMHHTRKTPVILHSGEEYMEKSSQIYSPDILSEIIPVIRAWQLNERMYGELQGLNKQEVLQQHGEEQFKLWRRSYDVPPPGGESLEMTAKRAIPYFQEHILSHLEKGKNVFIAAHGNSLRSIIMHLEGLSTEDVVHLELATGIPVIYTYANQSFTKL